MISSALDLFGDRWTLLIVRDMIIYCKTTFKEISESKERIASNILTSRLKHLLDLEIITKERSETNKKIFIYRLSEKGIALIPALTELTLWSDSFIRDGHPTMDSFVKNTVTADKQAFIHALEKNYRDTVLKK